MKLLATLLLLGMAPMAVHADPFGTITCHDLKGSSIHYGVPVWELARAKMDKKPMPKPHIVGPQPDGYDSDITFVISSSKKQMTVVWVESATDAKLRVDAKKFNMGPPSPPPPASDATIVMFDDDIISAVSTDEDMSISTYSFFPGMDSGFMTRQGRNALGQDTEATTVRMACTVSWNHWGPPVK